MLRVLFIWTGDAAGLRRRQLATLTNGLREWNCAVETLELAGPVWNPRVVWHIRTRLREFAPNVIHFAGPVPAMLRGLVPLFTRASLTAAPLPETASLRANCSPLSPRGRGVRGEGADQMRILCLVPDEPAAAKSALWTFDLLRLLDPTRGLQLTLAGKAAPQAEEFARRIGVRDAIEFLETPADLAQTYATIDLVWVPLPGPLASQAVVEACSAGKPVLACGANTPVCQALAETGAGQCFPLGDRIALARWTQHLWLNPDLRRRMAESARKAAMRFQPRESARQLLLHYRQLVAPMLRRRAA